MRKALTLFFTLFIYVNIFFSQTQWTVVNPPLSEYFKDVQVFGNQAAIAVGAKGSIYRTIDGGLTWSPHISPVNDDLNDVFFISPSKGWIVGGTSVLRTVDGGVTWLKVYTFSSTVLAVYFLDANTGFVAGAFGNIFKTTDGGLTWSSKASGLQFGWLSSIVFTDAMHGYAVGSDASYASTTDGGENWNLTEDPSGFGKWKQSIFFIDNNVGWIVGAGEPVKTTDGGVNWNTTNITSADFGNQIMHEVYFTDSNNGIIVGTGGKIARTTDGGGSWTISTVNSNDIYYSVRFDNTSTGWMVGFGGLILKSTDDGANWTYQNKPVTVKNLNKVYTKFPSEAWAVGDNGTLIHSTDAGATWTSVALGTNVQLTDITFPTDGNVGYAVGDGFTIFYTSDGGNNWSSRFTGTTQIYGISFINDSVGWTSGNVSVGRVFKTQDAGKTWTANNAVINLNIGPLTDIAVFGQGPTIVAVGWPGTIIKSTDGGSTFKIIHDGQSPPFNFPLNSVFFKDTTEGYAVGENGTILKTTDAGETWSLQTSGTTESLFDIYFLNDIDGWAVGSSGTSLVTHDNGATWQVEPKMTNFSLNSVAFFNGNEGVRVGESGIIHKGVYSPLINPINITFKVNMNRAKDARNNLPITNLIFVGMRGNSSFLGNWLDGGNWTTDDTVGGTYMKILYNDGTHGDEVAGDSIWTLEMTIPTNFVGSAYNGNQNLSYEYKFGAWYVGADTVNGGAAPMDNEMLQGIHHTISIQSGATITQNHIFGVRDVVTDVKTINSTIPKNYSLTQNYPNPFNPTTLINYSIPSPGLVTLKIFDVLGKVVKTLVNSEQAAGNYKVTFNASNLSSGVYFYRIEANRFVSTKKMLLLK